MDMTDVYTHVYMSTECKDKGILWSSEKPKGEQTHFCNLFLTDCLPLKPTVVHTKDSMNCKPSKGMSTEQCTARECPCSLLGGTGVLKPPGLWGGSQPLLLSSSWAQSPLQSSAPLWQRSKWIVMSLLRGKYHSLSQYRLWPFNLCYQFTQCLLCGSWLTWKS